MALFPDDQLSDVTTADGRTLQLPQSVIARLQMPTPAMQAPAPLAIPATTTAPLESTPDSVTGGVLPSPDALPPDAAEPIQHTPDYVAKTVDNSKAIAAVDRQEAKDKKAQAAKAAATPGGPAMAQAQNAQQGAIGNEAEATLKAADIDAAGMGMIANVQKTRNETINGFEQKKIADMEQAALETDKKQAEVDALRKKIGSTKIDRTFDHPILAAISAALFELGSAMKGDQAGKGVELIFKAIDRKVDAQMQNLDLMGKTYGMQKESLDALKDKSKRKLEFHNMMIAAESDKAIRQIEEMTSRTTSEKIKASGQIAIAQLQQRAAAAAMDAVKWGLDYDQKERAEKNQNSRFSMQLKQQERFHNDDMQLKREDMYLDYQKALAAEKAKGDEAAYKAKLQMINDNETRGLRNTYSGEALLTPQGTKMMEQAKALEEEAKNLREFDARAPGANPQSVETRAKALEEKAAILRGDAQISQQIRHRDPTQAGRLSDQYSEVQNMGMLVDEIIQLYDSPEGGKAWVSTGKVPAAIQSKMTELTMRLKNAWGLGVLSKQDTNLVNQGTGGDPTKADVGTVMHALGIDVGTDPEAFKARLQSLVSGSEDEIALKMKATNFSGTKKDLFQHRRDVENTPERKALRGSMKDKTPLEQESAARAKNDGVVGGALHGAAYMLNKVANPGAPGSPDEEARRAANSSNPEYGGLSNEQGAKIGQALQVYKAGNVEAGKALVAQASDTSRPQLSISMMHVLRDNAPDLYEQARANIKEGPVADQLNYEEQNRIGAAQTPTAILGQQALIDPEAFKELSRRAADKDPEARGIFLDVVKARQTRRDPLGIMTGGQQ